MTFIHSPPIPRKVIGTALAVVASLVLWGCGTDGAELRAVGIRADGCGAGAGKGSGLVVAPGVVLTSAHVVAGAG